MDKFLGLVIGCLLQVFGIGIVLAILITPGDQLFLATCGGMLIGLGFRISLISAKKDYNGRNGL